MLLDYYIINAKSYTITFILSIDKPVSAAIHLTIQHLPRTQGHFIKYFQWRDLESLFVLLLLLLLILLRVLVESGGIILYIYKRVLLIRFNVLNLIHLHFHKYLYEMIKPYKWSLWEAFLLLWIRSSLTLILRLYLHLVHALRYFLSWTFWHFFEFLNLGLAVHFYIILIKLLMINYQ